MGLHERLHEYSAEAIEGEDICCYCGKPGTDKVALPIFMQHPDRDHDGDLCHSECEAERIGDMYD